MRTACLAPPLRKVFLAEGGHLRGFRFHRQRARLDPAGVEQVADQAQHVVGLAVDDAEELQHLGPRQRGRGTQHRGGRALDGGQGRAQFVAHHAQELHPLPFQFLKRRQVLQGDDHRDDLLVVGTDRRHVDEGPDAGPARHRKHDFLGAHRGGVAECADQGDFRERDLAAVREAAGQHLEQIARSAARGVQSLDDAPRLPVDRHRARGPRVEHDDADRRSLDQGLEVRPGALFVAPRACVCDRGGSLGGEEHERLFILPGEFRGALLAGEEEAAHVLAPVAHRGDLEGPGRHRVLRTAVREDFGRQVGETHRPRKVPEVLEESRLFGPLRQLPVLLVGEAGGDKFAHLARLVGGGDDTVARAGERAGAVDDLLQHGGEIQTRIDAQDGRAQRSHPLLGPPGFASCLFGTVHWRTSSGSEPQPDRVRGSCPGAVSCFPCRGSENSTPAQRIPCRGRDRSRPGPVVRNGTMEAAWRMMMKITMPPPGEDSPSSPSPINSPWYFWNVRTIHVPGTTIPGN